VSKVFSATWQGCQIYFMRNVLGHAGRQGRRAVSPFIATTYAQDDAASASQQWRRVADQLRQGHCQSKYAGPVRPTAMVIKRRPDATRPKRRHAEA
jgi:transposase-like protein